MIRDKIRSHSPYRAGHNSPVRMEKMKGRIGTKHYDTEKADLIRIDPDGTQIFRKKTRLEFFRYNPAGETAQTRFQDLTPAESTELMPANTASRTATNSSKTVRFKPYALERIRHLALAEGLPVNQFLLMLVDRYEYNRR